MSAPTVSVLVTVYNREAYLADCLDSILASTWTDFEVVVVDDGSTDASVTIATAYAGKDNRIRFHRNERNLGDYPNRNCAASLARGTFLKYVDADDLIYAHSLAVMVKAMESNPEAALGISSNVADPEKPYPFLTSPVEVVRRHFTGKSLLGSGPTGAIIRRDAFESVGRFSGQQFIGDTELWLKLAEQWPVVSLPPALVWWRQHEGQQIHLELRTPELLNVRFNSDYAMLARTSHLTEAEKAQVRARLRQHHARRLWSFLLKRRRPVYFWRLFRASGLGGIDLIRGLRSYR